MRRCGTKPPCSAALPTTPGSARRPTRATASLPARPNPGPPRPVVIGAGPCGLLATLVLAQMGFRPLVLERGQPVRQRTVDTWGLWRRGVLQPESNVQFGEGGAGTFSDGKLYSQIRDPRHLGRKVLEEFVRAGAPEEILWVSKPHIGTFRLVTVVEAMRAEIERLGGEYRFNTRVADLEIEGVPGRLAAPARPGARWRRGDRGESRRAGARPQRPRPLRRPAPPRRRDGGQAVLDRRPHRAPAARDRPRPLRPERRQQAPRRRRLPPRPPLRERPRRLQLLHVPRRPRGRRHQRARPRRHQRHEPVFPRRVQRQCRPRRRHRTGGLPRRRARRRRFQRRWERAAFEAGGGDYRAPRSASKTSSPAARPPRSARWRRAISPAPARPTWPPACRTTPSPPSAKRCPPSPASYRASPWPTRW